MLACVFVGVKNLSIETCNIVTNTSNDDSPVTRDYDNLLVSECNLLYYITIEKWLLM